MGTFEGWTIDGDMCTFPGVRCKNGRVSLLCAPARQMAREFLAHACSLALIRRSMSSKDLKGTIMARLGELSELEAL